MLLLLQPTSFAIYRTDSPPRQNISDIRSRSEGTKFGAILVWHFRTVGENFWYCNTRGQMFYGGWRGVCTPPSRLVPSVGKGTTSTDKGRLGNFSTASYGVALFSTVTRVRKTIKKYVGRTVFSGSLCMHISIFPHGLYDCVYWGYYVEVQQRKEYAVN